MGGRSGAVCKEAEVWCCRHIIGFINREDE